MQPVLCGIDFGTSNSAVALAEDGGVRLADVEQGQVTIPSAIFIGADEAALFGRRAIAAYVERTPGRFMRSLKRVLGTPLMQEGTSFGHKRLSFHDLLTRFVTHLHERAEAAAGTSIRHVVAGRPVHFVDASEKADAEAETQLRAVFRAAGFDEVQFQYEPLAAAFAHEARLPADADAREYLAFVIDIGGGTSDFAVVKLSGRYVAEGARKRDRRKDILASAGVRVGGNDFDRTLSLAAVMPLLGKGTAYGPKSLPFPAAPFHDLSEWSRIQHMYTRGYRQKLEALIVGAHEPDRVGRLLTVVDHELGHGLLAAVEETKIELSASTEAVTDLGVVAGGVQARTARAEFEEKIEPNLAKLREAMALCLERAGAGAGKIDLVVLTGGATYMPSLQALARETFPNAVLSESDRMASVATGLAYTTLQRRTVRKSARPRTPALV